MLRQAAIIVVNNWRKSQAGKEKFCALRGTGDSAHHHLFRPKVDELEGTLAYGFGERASNSSKRQQ